MKLRYDLESNRINGFDCLVADCDRKTVWRLESSPMQYRAYSCRVHYDAVSLQLIMAESSSLSVLTVAQAGDR